MEINANTLVNTSTYSQAKSFSSSGTAEAKPAVQTETVAEDVAQANGKSTKNQEMSKEDVEQTTNDLNKIMQLLNADLQFALHEKTQRMMVQLVDVKDNKVLKEFPPHELLDTIAAIRDYIGILLDKKV